MVARAKYRKAITRKMARRRDELERYRYLIEDLSIDPKDLKPGKIIFVEAKVTRRWWQF